jgi:predicted nucleotidyltransferase
MSISGCSRLWPDSVEEAFKATAGFSLSDHLQYVCYVGSTSHNTYVPKDDPKAIDDIDLFIAVIPPIEKILSLSHESKGSRDPEVGPWKQTEHLMVGEWDLTVHSMSKYIGLLLKGNPTMLSTLWVRPEDRVHCTHLFEQALIRNRDKFSTKESVHAFLGYANDQFRKMTSGENAYQGYMGEKRKALVNKFGYDTKNAAHLIRLLKMGVEFLGTGQLKVYRDDDAEMLRSIKRGDWKLEAIQELSEDLFDQAREAYKKSPLPEGPDFEFANTTLLDFYRCAWRIQGV